MAGVLTRTAICLLTTACFLSATTTISAQTIRPLSKRIRSPSIDAPGDWINTNGPLRLADLRGKFVILDFWTYCCINCMHILPELKKLEDAYPDSIVVIGVHSPKFVTERDTENVREAVVREKIVHPVFNDPRRVLWQRFEVDVWPSLRVIDPEGYVVAVHEGETTFRELDKLMKPLVSKYRRKRVLDETPLHFAQESAKRKATPLRYPGKVLADAASDRVFIADTYHNRIVITQLDGTLAGQIGSGATGRDDGSFADSTFDHPQGMALNGDSLYIADTENHLIRKADLKAETVTTVAGTGVQRKRQEVRGSSRPKGMMLASPWDLLVVGNDLFIAMAGSHQIWKMPLDESRIGPYAGSGGEDIVDGARLARKPYAKGASEFAQPSGLGTDGTWVFVADSEGSSIRAVPIDPMKDVVTVLGTSRLKENRLFTFGDRDGNLRTAMLQHPVGLTFADGVIYVADTYNDKVRAIDITKGSVKTLAGERALNPAEDGSENQVLNEPSGVSVAAGKLYIADTNSHRIRVLDLKSPGDSITTLDLNGLKPPSPTPEKWKPLPGATVVKFDTMQVTPSDDVVKIHLKLTLPLGFKWNREAGFQCRLDVAGDEPLFDKKRLADISEKDIDPTQAIVLEAPLAAQSGSDRIRVAATFFYCQEGRESVCRIGEVHWIGQVDVTANAAKQLDLEHTIRVK